MSSEYKKYSFNVEIDCPNCAKKVETRLNGTEGVRNADFNFPKGKLTLESTLSPSAIRDICLSVEDDMKFLDKIQRYEFKVEIDCANCAKKVEDKLNETPEVEKAAFNFPKAKLTVETSLSKDKIKEICLGVEDDMKFLEDETKRYIFDVEIDCAECAMEVQEALEGHEGVIDADFNFPKGKLTVETTLSEEEIKKICLSVEDEMKFLEKTTKNHFVFDVEIDCAECAMEVEEALNGSEGIEKAVFNFPKGKLTVDGSLSEEEIKKICLSVEDEMVFKGTEEEKKEKDWDLYRIIGAVVLLALSFATGLEWIAVIAYVIAGYDVLIKAFKNILKGSFFDENFLMAIATLGALFISSYDEAAGVMIFYQIGEYFQGKAVGKSRANISKLMDLSSDSVTMMKDGEWVEAKPEEIQIGSKVLLKAGDKVAVDGTVLEGSSFVDTRALTGESVPVKKEVGDKVLSGSVNGDSTLILQADAIYSESTASKVMKLVEESEGKKAETEKFITRFSKYYTPFVCIAAILLAVVPPLFGLATWDGAMYRACMLLVISCPCALVLSVPLTYFAAMGAFAKNGILVKGDSAIQNLSRIDSIAMDKTGTLTEGVFSVQMIKLYEGTEEQLLAVAATLEKESSHPIAKAIIEKAPKSDLKASDVKTIPGIGLEGMVAGKKVLVGSQRILEGAPILDEDGTHVYVVEENTLLGIIVISDKIKETSYGAISALRELGVKEISMLSGDRKERAEKTAEKLGMDKAFGELLPQDKLTALDSLKGEGKTVGYVGDGINDAPSLKSADVGIAMGGVGSDAAIEAADAVIMNDDIAKVPTAIRIARKTEFICRENIWLSLLVKAIVFILAVLGISNMWLAVFADTGVCFVAVINSMRALKHKGN